MFAMHFALVALWLWWGRDLGEISASGRGNLLFPFTPHDAGWLRALKGGFLEDSCLQRSVPMTNRTITALARGYRHMLRWARRGSRRFAF